MNDVTVADDFYEDDEPVDKIRAILERPADGVTKPPPGVVVGRFSPRLVGNRTESPATRVS